MGDKIKIFFTEKENNQQNNQEITYDDLVKEVDIMEMTANICTEDTIALEIDYETNYTKKELEKIIDYYQLDKRGKKKSDLITSIINFEEDISNIETVHKRKRLWSYIQEIKEDKYLSKYLIFD